VSAPDDLVDAKVAAGEILAIPEGTVGSMTSRGELPCYRIAVRITRYSRRELLEWLESRRVEAAPADELRRRRLERRRGRAK
jgi:hypothetical protein